MLPVLDLYYKNTPLLDLSIRFDIYATVEDFINWTSSDSAPPRKKLFGSEFYNNFTRIVSNFNMTINNSLCTIVKKSYTDFCNTVRDFGKQFSIGSDGEKFDIIDLARHLLDKSNIYGNVAMYVFQDNGALCRTEVSIQYAGVLQSLMDVHSLYTIHALPSKSISSDIYNMSKLTQYNILPRRFMYPSNFEHKVVKQDGALKMTSSAVCDYFFLGRDNKKHFFGDFDTNHIVLNCHNFIAYISIIDSRKLQERTEQYSKEHLMLETKYRVLL